jgi:hypothetical protein
MIAHPKKCQVVFFKSEKLETLIDGRETWVQIQQPAKSLNFASFRNPMPKLGDLPFDEECDDEI